MKAFTKNIVVNFGIIINIVFLLFFLVILVTAKPKMEQGFERREGSSSCLANGKHDKKATGCQQGAKKQPADQSLFFAITVTMTI